MSNRPEPRNIYRLGLVSLLNDISSDALTRVVPLFVSDVLHAPMSIVGFIEGLADSTSTVLKPYFGHWSDRTGARKPFVLWGYAFSALTRPALAFVGAWPQAAALRFLDRVGKAVRTAPRDALIADSSGDSFGHGRSFGINRAMDTLGALISVGLLAFYLKSHGELQITRESWKFLCLGLSVPGIIAVLVVAAGVREARVREEAGDPSGGHSPLSPVFKRYLLCVALFALANSSDAFVLLRLRELGYSLPEMLGLVAINQVVAAASSLPAASLSDRLGRKPLLVVGWGIYAACYALFGTSVMTQGWAVVLTMALYGLFAGFTEGVEKAWVADLSPARSRGKAFGLFSLVLGAMALPASVAFGAAWEAWGSLVPFLGSAVLAGVSLILLSFFVPSGKETTHGR